VKRELMTVAFGKSTLPVSGSTANSASATTMSRSPRPTPGGLSYNGLHKTRTVSSSSNSEQQQQRCSSSGNTVVSAQELLAARNGRANGQSSFDNGFDNGYDNGSIVNGLDSSEQELLREEELFVASQLASQRLQNWLCDAAQEAATAGTALQVLLRLHEDSAAACISGDATDSSGDVVQKLIEFRGTMASMGLFSEACGTAPGVWQEGSAEAVQVTSNTITATLSLRLYHCYYD
jgi:hypothetical protein